MSACWFLSFQISSHQNVYTLKLRIRYNPWCTGHECHHALWLTRKAHLCGKHVSLWSEVHNVEISLTDIRSVFTRTQRVICFTFYTYFSREI